MKSLNNNKNIVLCFAIIIVISNVVCAQFIHPPINVLKVNKKFKLYSEKGVKSIYEYDFHINNGEIEDSILLSKYYLNKKGLVDSIYDFSDSCMYDYYYQDTLIEKIVLNDSIIIFAFKYSNNLLKEAIHLSFGMENIYNYTYDKYDSLHIIKRNNEPIYKIDYIKDLNKSEVTNKIVSIVNTDSLLSKHFFAYNDGILINEKYNTKRSKYDIKYLYRNNILVKKIIKNTNLFDDNSNIKTILYSYSQNQLISKTTCSKNHSTINYFNYKNGLLSKIFTYDIMLMSNTSCVGFYYTFE